MIIAAAAIEQSGPGVDLSNQPGDLSVLLADPVRDLEYALNSVTLVFDLSGVESARLKFQALEFGDEPHAPPPGPFGDDAKFDGVAVSADGVNWYEIQGLRGLRSDRYTAFDLDLNALVAGLGLSYNKSFRIRFCQYDDNPAPMDGIAIKGIELVAEMRPPILHLAMDDNAASAVVADSAAGHLNQTFLDAGGNPNTSAHSVPGRVGTALSFDGVDDKILCGTTFMNDVLAAGHDWTVTFWWKPAAVPGGSLLLNSATVNGHMQGFNVHTYWTTYISMYLYFEGGTEKHLNSRVQDVSGWHHYAFLRRGNTIETYTDGVAGTSFSAPEYSGSLANAGNFQIGYSSASALDDFRVYDRALSVAELQGLASDL
jgi:hypothetical protein